MTDQNTISLINNNVRVFREVVLVVLEVLVVVIGVGEEMVDIDFVLEILVFSFSIVPIEHKLNVVFHGEVEEVGGEGCFLGLAVAEGGDVGGGLLAEIDHVLSPLLYYFQGESDVLLAEFDLVNRAKLGQDEVQSARVFLVNCCEGCLDKNWKDFLGF